MPQVVIREVGLRDGLQMAKEIVATERKVAWCRAEADAGVPEMEVTSFVPARIVPQFHDAAAVIAGTDDVATVRSVLVPNLRGAQLAFDSGIGKINYVLSASEAHNHANVRQSTAESIDGMRRIVDERRARGLATILAGGVATAFGCTIQGAVAEGRVFEIVEALVDAGADEIVIADTVGYANPVQVKRILRAVADRVGGRPLFAHFHDTRGLGLANVVAALDAGVTRFDASLGGLGGCPFAPGATGNINTEDCVYLVEAMGFDTGIDLDALIRLRDKIEAWLPAESFTGALARAGTPKTFRTAA